MNDAREPPVICVARCTRLPLCSGAVVVCVALYGSGVHAAAATDTAPETDQPAGLSPFAPDLAIHGTLTVGALAVVVLYRLAVLPSLPGGLVCTPLAGSDHCDPSELNSLDRSVVDNGSPPLAAVSDVMLAASVALPLIALSVDALGADSAAPWADLLSDVVVWGEAVSVAALANMVVAAAVRRPRPTQYLAGYPRLDAASALSFPSGHASTVTAAVVAYAMIFGRRHPDSMWRHAVYIGAAAMSLATAVGRVADRRHFYTDVIAGTLLGAVVGFVVPYLHLRGGRSLSVAPVSGVRDGVQTYGLQMDGRF